MVYGTYNLLRGYAPAADPWERVSLEPFLQWTSSTVMAAEAQSKSLVCFHVFHVRGTQATNRVYSLATRSWIYSRRHTSMQRMHCLCLRLPSCSSHESTPGPLAPTRNPPPARSNPRGHSQGNSEIHEARQTSMRAEGPKTDPAHSSNQQLAVGPDTAPPRLHYTSARTVLSLCKALWQQGASITAAVMAAANNFALPMACSQVAHIRMHVQHAARWCTQHWLPAEFG